MPGQGCVCDVGTCGCGEVVPLEGETLNSLFDTLAEWNKELEEMKVGALIHPPEPSDF